MMAMMEYPVVTGETEVMEVMEETGRMAMMAMMEYPVVTGETEVLVVRGLRGLHQQAPLIHRLSTKAGLDHTHTLSRRLLWKRKK